MRPAFRAGLAAMILFCTMGVQGAAAQDYDDAYDGPPPRRGYEERGPRPRSRATGLNCDAVQSGIAGLLPYSCPLAGPRPLGTRCYCDMPIAPFNGPQTAVGRVVP